MAVRYINHFPAVRKEVRKIFLTAHVGTMLRFAEDAHDTVPVRTGLLRANLQVDDHLNTRVENKGRPALTANRAFLTRFLRRHARTAKAARIPNLFGFNNVHYAVFVNNRTNYFSNAIQRSARMGTGSLLRRR